MKFCLKLSLIFLILLCLASPSLAWEQSFEGHSKDEPSSTVSGGATTLFYENGYCKFASGSSNTLLFVEPWENHIAFSVKSVGTSPQIKFMLYSTDFLDSHLLSSTSYVSLPSAANDTVATWHRVEFSLSPDGTQIQYFIDGVSSGSLAVTGQLSTQQRISIVTGTGNYYFDDFSSSEGGWLVSCDPSYKVGDAGQYFRVGFSPSPGVNWYSRVMGPTGKTMNINPENLSVHQIPSSFITDPGTYLIKLYQDGTPLASRSFVYSTPGEVQLNLDKTDYSPGDTIQITTYVKNYQGYTVELPYYDSDGKLQTYTYDLSSSDQTAYFTIPKTARGGSFVGALLDSYGGVALGKQYSIMASGGITSLSIDKTVYAPLDVVKISYSNMPLSTKITIRVQNGNSQVTNNTWAGVAGSGVLTYTIPSTSADNFYVYAISGTTQLGQTTGTIKSGIYYLSGHIINPLDGSLIPGASIVIGTASTISDTNGAFNFSVPAGWQSLSVTKTGYQSNINKVNIVYPVATQDFYLVPSYSGNGHSIYGIVTDYYTGAPVSSAFITLKQGSITHTLFSYTNTGYYIYDAADMIGTWNLTVSKNGYYTYSGTISLSGDTYKQINLTPIKFSSTGDTGSSNSSSLDGSSISSGSSGSAIDANTIDATGVSADRPGREAAKNSMAEFEQVVPSLLGLVVFKIVMELLK